MSHFTVLVRVSAARIFCNGGLKKALDVMLAPFKEETEDKRFIVFNDQEDEFRQEYANMVLNEDGKLYFSFDNRFRVPGDIFVTHKAPAHLARENIPVNQYYSTFEEFCKEYHVQEGP